jgi:hypothetical protein
VPAVPPFARLPPCDRGTYALYWSAPESQWGWSWRIFKVLAETFRRAAP